jgi:hypothetical protein
MLLHKAPDETKAININAVFYSPQFICKLLTLNLQKTHRLPFKDQLTKGASASLVVCEISICKSALDTADI